MTQLAGDRQARRREIDHPGAAVEFRFDPAADRHAFQPLQEVDVKEGSAELAVGDAFQADVLLLLDDVADVSVFDLSQLGLGDGARLLSLARLNERRRPEEAADVVGAGRVGLLCSWPRIICYNTRHAASRISGRRRRGRRGRRRGAQTPAANAPARKGRIKQALMRFNFGRDTTLSFDDMCREAARVGFHGFDLVGPQDWPTLKKYGLVCTMAPAMGVTIRDGLIRPELHDAIERSMHGEIDQCAANSWPNFITVGGERRGIGSEEGKRPRGRDPQSCQGPRRRQGSDDLHRGRQQQATPIRSSAAPTPSSTISAGASISASG